MAKAKKTKTTTKSTKTNKSTKRTTKRRSRKKKPAPPKPLTAEDRTVDRMLIALQKSLSRVSRDSADVPEDQARALIVGNVAFEVTVKCELGPGEKLMLNPLEGSPLTLRGEILSDVGVHLDQESANG